MRRHLGVETQRQWSELAIRRTTPALLGLFSLVALFAHQRRMARSADFVQRAACYHKPYPTFSDALALVRRDLWAQATFCVSPGESDTVKVPRGFHERLTETFAVRRDGQSRAKVACGIAIEVVFADESGPPGEDAFGAGRLFGGWDRQKKRLRVPPGAPGGA